MADDAAHQAGLHYPVRITHTAHQAGSHPSSESPMLFTRQARIPLQKLPRLGRRQSSGSPLSPASGLTNQPSWSLQESTLLCRDADLCGWTSQGFYASPSGHMLESICRFPAGRNAAWVCALACGAFLWLDYRDSGLCHQDLFPLF